MITILPQSVKACLWSYDTDKIDLSNEGHRHIVIHNILDRGTSEAVIWLRHTFPETEIKETITKSGSSHWNKKSLALWSLIYHTVPSKKGRFA